MATYFVTVATDEDDGNTSAGDLSLREAVALANADSGADTITFGLAAGSTITLTLGELTLSQDVTINGDVNGDHKADITISGNDANRIFNISGLDTDAALRSLTITDGYSSGQGGAVYAYEINTLSITDTTIKDSVSETMGGGIRVYWGTVSIANSLIANNFAGDEGGGAFFSTSTVAMTNTTVYSNFSAGAGGGLSLWGPSSLSLANCDIVNNVASYEGSISFAGGGLYIFEPSAGDTSVEIKNSLFGNASGAGFEWNDVYGIVDQATKSAFTSEVMIASDDGSFVITDPSSFSVGLLADNGGTVATLARGVLNILTDTGKSAALPTDVNDVDHDDVTAEVLPLAANGVARVTGPEVDIGAFEYDGGTGLFDALEALPLLDSNGNFITPDSLFAGSNETIVFLIKSTNYADGTIDMFTAGQVIQANQLMAAAQLAGHPLDVVLICLDGYAGPLPGLSNGARVLHLDDPSSAASKSAVDALYDTWDPRYSLYGENTNVSLIPSFALHRAPGADSVEAVRSIEPTTTYLGVAGQFQQSVTASHLEEALDATGNAVDLADVLIPTVTTPVGAYDAVGEFIPDLTFVDQNGESLSLHGLGEGLVVLSTCTGWCGPCFIYADDLNSIGAAVSPVFNFVELLVENRASGLSFTLDADRWATRFDLTLPVLTPDGNVPLVANFIRGINLTAYPDYIVMDGATGQIVARFTGYNGVVSDKAAELDAIAEAYYKPVFSSAATTSVAENSASTAVVYDAEATDKDDKPGSPSIEYSLTGTDAAKFSIEAATGKVRFLASPDFEVPSDAGADNTYDITVRADDGVNVTNLAVRVSVTDKLEGATTDGNDTISGTAANETFRGALGNDLLIGKAGVDTFVFDTKLGTSNVDRIGDFTPGTDLIQLDRSFFKKLAIGDLKAKVFTAGKVKSDDRIIYNKQTGDLSFDIDGKGGKKAIKFATLDGSPDALSAQDFVVIA